MNPMIYMKLAGRAVEALGTGPQPLSPGEALRRLGEHVDAVEVDPAGVPFLRGGAAPEATGKAAVAAALADRVRIDLKREARGEAPAREPVRDIVLELEQIKAEMIESRTRQTGRKLSDALTPEGFLR